MEEERECERKKGGGKNRNGKAGNGNGNDPAPTNKILFSLKIGFFAGVFWGLIRWLATGLNLTNVHQAFLLDPFVPRSYLAGFYWQLAGWGMFILMSMLAAVVYVAALGRLGGPWPGFWFGALWWALCYAWLGPLVGTVPPLREIGWSSIATDFCLFLAWGLFIGYSIAFELHDESGREPTANGRGDSPQPAS
ncbi:YqhR family membrane protein [Cohnella suwonensis]|uniref:YqhR family membrane protein n=1 Tax=Cohnella suwonensis TaxID=696072 RepID=A0ABW0LSZ8_9BACL